jgi:hypothetical protein
MKWSYSFRRAALIAGGVVWGFHALGQVEFETRDITGTIAFSNNNPEVLSLLDAPEYDGMSNLFVSVTGCRSRQASSLVTTLPWTSVSRKSRP